MKKRRFLLSRLIKREIDNTNSFRFEEAITEECETLAAEGFSIPSNIRGELATAPTRIDRHKLDRIADEDDLVPLRLWELRVLTSYFQRKHGIDFSETAIFEKVSVYESIVRCGKVCFLLGMRPETNDRFNYLRFWDLHAMSTVAGEIYRTGQRVELDWQYVPPQFPNVLAARELQDQSLISIGSPRSNEATELLLAKMFGVPPFQRGINSRHRPLPFRFVWPDSNSSFSVPIDWLRASTSEEHFAQLAEGKASAMLINQRPYVVPNDYAGDTVKITGVIALQRLSSESIVTVIAGLSGPATYGAASLLKEMAADLPPFQANQRSVLWAAVEVGITTDPSSAGDARTPKDANFIGDPEIWQTGV